jgi:hypothetical protein
MFNLVFFSSAMPINNEELYVHFAIFTFIMALSTYAPPSYNIVEEYGQYCKLWLSIINVVS